MSEGKEKCFPPEKGEKPTLQNNNDGDGEIYNGNKNSSCLEKMDIDDKANIAAPKESNKAKGGFNKPTEKNSKESGQSLSAQATDEKTNGNAGKGVTDSAIEKSSSSLKKMDIDDKTNNVISPVKMLKVEKIIKQENIKKEPKESGQSSSAQTVDEKGTKRRESLPPDWKMVWHDSGVPIYLHKPTRVCTLSRPYYPEATKGIPLSAIPCVSQRRALEYGDKKIQCGRIVRNEMRIKKSTETQKHQNLKQFQNQMEDNLPVSSCSAQVKIKKEPSIEENAMDVVEGGNNEKQDVAACVGYAVNKGCSGFSSSSGSSHMPSIKNNTAPASQQSESPNTNSGNSTPPQSNERKGSNKIAMKPVKYTQSNQTSRPVRPDIYPRRDPYLSSTSNSYNPQSRRHGFRAMPTNEM
ncbi:uncharacterized protein LOC126780400 [Nymphalis io]|uniref:uncharacterized protein LOC126780400 n=1 Tax=Inachis io TaxID=171585 RepID=UPI002167ED72|nr:uncharacterized protein LOC126780400 [Nymphalis io]